MMFENDNVEDNENRTRVVTTIRTEEGSSLKDKTSSVPIIRDISHMKKEIKSIETRKFVDAYGR